MKWSRLNAYTIATGIAPMSAPAMSIGTLFTLGVFLKPIEDSMGWSRAGIGAIGLFSWIVMGAGGLVSGFVSDRAGTRRVVLVGAGLLAAGLLLSSHVQQLWHFYVTYGLLVGAGVSAFYVPLTVLAIKWFEGRRAMKYGKNQKLAKDFLKWLHGKEQYGKWFQVAEGFSIGSTKLWEQSPMWNTIDEPMSTPPATGIVFPSSRSGAPA